MNLFLLIQQKIHEINLNFTVRYYIIINVKKKESGPDLLPGMVPDAAEKRWTLVQTDSYMSCMKIG